MIIINTIDEKYFELNGTRFARIFHPLKLGNDKVALYNIFDTRLQILPGVHYSEVSVDATAFDSQAALISALLPVVYVSFAESVNIDDYQLKNEKGTAGGYAPLSSSGKIDAAFLPSYVDDVAEFSAVSNFPSTGETGKLYIAKDTNFIYRWTGRHIFR